MEDKTFLKSLTILYVEDSKTIRVAMQNEIGSLFKNFYTAVDGEEALRRYNILKSKNIKLNAIISDINMPKMDGIELLENLRADDPDIPVLFTTAHFEKDYLLRAIDLNATEYILKPINIDDALKKIVRECKINSQKEAITHQKEELESYLEAIDNIATISKTDSKGNIIFANKLFCDISQYSLEELINQPHSIVRHPDTPSETFKKLWDTIQTGKKWNGKLKNKAKDGSVYYTNTTIIPRYDEFGQKIVEYISIKFIITEDELEKREFKKKVMQNVKDNRQQKIENEKYIKSLEDKLKKGNSSLSIHLEDSLSNERKKTTKLHTQIEFYEEEIKNNESKYGKIVETSNEKIKKAFFYAKKLKNENEKFVIDIDSLEADLEEKNESLLKLQEMISTQKKTISDLRDVIQHREDQLGMD